MLHLTGAADLFDSWFLLFKGVLNLLSNNQQKPLTADQIIDSSIPRQSIETTQIKQVQITIRRVEFEDG